MLCASRIWQGRSNMEADNGNHFLQRYQLEVPTAITDIASNNESKSLPNTYVPSDYDVVCGRGKGNYKRPGNKQLHDIIQQYLHTYSEAKTKLDKTLVLDDIIDRVRAQNNGTARFVKFDPITGWVEISSEQAREKVGHAIRQVLMSSNHNKKNGAKKIT